jgi:hypothetical protein
MGAPLDVVRVDCLIAEQGPARKPGWTIEPSPTFHDGLLV